MEYPNLIWMHYCQNLKKTVKLMRLYCLDHGQKEHSEMDQIFYFEECMECYLFYVSESKNNDLHKINLLTLVHPWIVKLITFDKENKTEFLKTLQSYIENNRNANITSNKLNIHRSTLFYRFNKIQEFLGISLDNSNNLFNLELSFKILSYNTIINKRDI